MGQEIIDIGVSSYAWLDRGKVFGEQPAEYDIRCTCRRRNFMGVKYVQYVLPEYSVWRYEGDGKGPLLTATAEEFLSSWRERHEDNPKNRSALA